MSTEYRTITEIMKRFISCRSVPIRHIVGVIGGFDSFVIELSAFRKEQLLHVHQLKLPKVDEHRVPKMGKHGVPKMNKHGVPMKGKHGVPYERARST